MLQSKVSRTSLHVPQPHGLEQLVSSVMVKVRVDSHLPSGVRGGGGGGGSGGWDGGGGGFKGGSRGGEAPHAIRWVAIWQVASERALPEV